MFYVLKTENEFNWKIIVFLHILPGADDIIIVSTHILPGPDDIVIVSSAGYFYMYYREQTTSLSLAVLACILLS